MERFFWESDGSGDNFFDDAPASQPYIVSPQAGGVIGGLPMAAASIGFDGYSSAVGAGAEPLCCKQGWCTGNICDKKEEPAGMTVANGCTGCDCCPEDPSCPCGEINYSQTQNRRNKKTPPKRYKKYHGFDGMDSRKCPTQHGCVMRGGFCDCRRATSAPLHWQNARGRGQARHWRCGWGCAQDYVCTERGCKLWYTANPDEIIN